EAYRGPEDQDQGSRRKNGAQAAGSPGQDPRTRRSRAQPGGNGREDARAEQADPGGDDQDDGGHPHAGARETPQADRTSGARPGSLERSQGAGGTEADRRAERTDQDDQ